VPFFREGVLMNNNCAQCVALWRDYAASTHAHFAIESKLQVVGLSHDHAAVKRLLPEAQAAAEGRSELRRQIREHEQEAHSTPDDGFEIDGNAEATAP
jgi:hypothetical protein